MAYRYKLSELAKKASADEAEKELGIPKSRFEVGQVTYSDDGTSKSEITDIDPETGAVKWEITQLPGFDLLYDEIDDLVDISKRVYIKTKDDKKFREFYDEIRKLRNSIRTHLRNEYPDQYKRITRIGEMYSKGILDLDKEEKVKEGTCGYGEDGVVGDKPAGPDLMKEFVGGQLEKRSDVLFNQLVPSSGAAETVEGELIRAINRLIYRFYNDGDYFYKGYGAETAGPAHSFLVNSDQIPFDLQSTLTSTFNKAMGADEDGYERLIKFALEKILDHVEATPIDEYTPLKKEMFDFESEFEDEEDDYDDYYDEYEEDEEYYEDGIEEVSMTGGGAASQATFTPGIGGQYATPYAFRLKGQKPNDKAYKELGYKPVNEKELTKSEKNKLKKVSSQLKKSVKAHDKQAKTIDKAIRNEAYGDCADLGPGPKASEDGVNDNYYVKAFKYKLVPKKIKGSGLEVNKLF